MANVPGAVHEAMINSALLYLRGEKESEAAIRLGVAVAAQTDARVRGLTLLDTRQTDEASNCESAVYADLAYSRQALMERQQRRVQRQLSQACLKCGLDFDIRRAAGSPLQVLPRESRFHDLVVTSVDPAAYDSSVAGRRTLYDLPELVKRGVQPLLIVHCKQRSLHRVLMAYDGSDAAGRAIRSFLAQRLLPEAECRLLAIGGSEAMARTLMRDMAAACQTRRPSAEYGYAVGKYRRCVANYAEKWQADLVVLGASAGRGLASRLLGTTEFDVLQRLQRSLYVAT